MITIAITETAENADEMADRLRYIAGLLEQGFTSGYDPAWSLSDADGEDGYRAAQLAHEHHHEGQTLRHVHRGGDLPHGYYEHPEDGA